jgi:hypothetical protein
VSAGERAFYPYSQIHDLVIRDNSIPGLSGVEMVHKLKLKSAATPGLICTRQGAKDTSCIDLIFERPVHLLRLKHAVKRLISDRVPFLGNFDSPGFFSSGVSTVSFDFANLAAGRW